MSTLPSIGALVAKIFRHSNTQLTLHGLRPWGLLLFTKVNLVVDLGRHTTAYAAEGHISNAIDDADTGPLSIPIEANANAAENYGKTHQTSWNSG